MSNIILGVDLSKLTFNVALLNDNKVKTKKFSNTSKGFSELKQWYRYCSRLYGSDGWSF